MELGWLKGLMQISRARWLQRWRGLAIRLQYEVIPRLEFSDDINWCMTSFPLNLDQWRAIPMILFRVGDPSPALPFRSQSHTRVRLD